MQLALATWHEVEDYLRSSRGIIIPIGATEQHGPNGLIGTDHLDAEFVSKGVGDTLGCLVAPTLTIGMSQHHMAFTGSITLRPTTLIAVVNDVVNSLIRHGFERFLFINGHGGNIAPVSTAFAEIYADVSIRGQTESWPVRCKMVMWADGPRCRKLTKELYGDFEAATPPRRKCRCRNTTSRSTSSTHRCRPRWRPRSPVFYDSADYRRRFPDGRIGSDPSLSSPEHGEQIYRAAVEDMVEVYRKFVAD